MDYFLRNTLLPVERPTAITAQQYADFETARDALAIALGVEETYEILITNYLDFERQLLDTTLGFMIRQHLDYSDFFQSRLGPNVRLVNLLTAARLYTDHLKKNVKLCLPDPGAAQKKVNQLFSTEYDRNKQYRIMEALRNHVQHARAPVHLARLGAAWTSAPGDSLFEYSMQIVSQRSLLELDDKVPKKILDQVGDEIDLKATARGYIESISHIHQSIRDMIDDSVTAAREVIDNALKQYAASHPNIPTWLIASKQSDATTASSIHLTLEWDNVRQQLVRRNRRLPLLGRSHVTGSLQTRDNSTPAPRSA